ncbi:MAG: hypothetical protein AB8C46_00110 [Burkholderiaceae bacterium]
MKPILLTGFEPFGKWRLNPSQVIVEDFARMPPVPNLVCQVLPTVYEHAGNRIRSLIAEHQPQIILCLGLSSQRNLICLERFALNVDDVSQPDNSKSVRQGDPIDPVGPAAYRTNVDLEPLLKALIHNGLAAEISNHAGTYVCNHVFYQALRANLEAGGQAGTLFMHLPIVKEALEGEAAAQCGWTVGMLTQAVEIVLTGLIQQSPEANQ